MKYSFFLSFSLACGWMLSPESLTVVGNSGGKLGWLSFLFLPAALLLFFLCNQLLNHPQLPDSDNKAFVLLQNSFGKIPAAALTIAACLPLTILAATALLVTSGYTFNEVFLYWFPNFGLAFLLLALLTTLQFFPQKYSHLAQVIFMSAAVAGLLILSLYGIVGASEPTAKLLHSPQQFSASEPALLLLLFTGLTLAPAARKLSTSGLFIGAVLMVLWIAASLIHVSPERLGSSTIPYMTAARKIMGDPGRQIMGVVVISGTCAAINGLMLLSKQMICNITPAFLPEKSRHWLIPSVIALNAGALMATGLAGDEILETLLRSALILWLLYYTLLCFSAALWLKKETRESVLMPVAAAFILMAGLTVLVFGNPDSGKISVFILSTLGCTTLWAVAWFFIHSQQNSTD